MIYYRSRTLIPCILAIARSGRKALRVRIVLKAWIPLAPNKAAIKFIRDTCVSRAIENTHITKR